jgi:hypothetical protein
MKRWRTSSAGCAPTTLRRVALSVSNGLDVYALRESLYAVFDYLEEHHREGGTGG